MSGAEADLLDNAADADFGGVDVVGTHLGERRLP
jgi:hypothetical protein